MGWIWRKRESLGKKVLAAVLVMFSAPFLVPPLIVASTIALVSSLPYCFLLASYVCTEKLMRKLLPATAFDGRGDKMVLLHDNVGHGDIYDDGMARVAMSDPCCVQTGEEGTAAISFKEGDNDHVRPLRVITSIMFDVYQSPEDIRKESKSLLESIRDDESSVNQSLGRGISEKAFVEDNKDSTRVEDLSGKKRLYETRLEGRALEGTTKEASRGKTVEKSSNEMKVLYSEEQIWAKMEKLRKIIGYGVARSTTYSEELKALYMFMGLELPPLTMLEMENQDTAHVSERLCGLMSVIGIK